MNKIADILVRSCSCIRPTDRYTGRRLYPTHEQIATLAYCLYESCGRRDGYQVEDWLHAGEQLERHYA